LRPDRTLRERTGTHDEDERAHISADLVSDYVADRLEPSVARLIEVAAQRDPDLTRAIERARAVRRRVKARLTGPRQ
jgi:hypothetical protein